MLKYSVGCSPCVFVRRSVRPLGCLCVLINAPHVPTNRTAQLSKNGKGSSESFFKNVCKALNVSLSAPQRVCVRALNETFLASQYTGSSDERWRGKRGVLLALGGTVVLSFSPLPLLFSQSPAGHPFNQRLNKSLSWLIFGLEFK